MHYGARKLVRAACCKFGIPGRLHANRRRNVVNTGQQVPSRMPVGIAVSTGKQKEPKSTKHAAIPPDGMPARKKGKHMRPADQRAARRKRRK